MNDFESRLTENVAKLVYDPYNFVRFAYPWGEAGPLLECEGPDTWQKTLLQELGRQLRLDDDKAVQIATASGHGVGKVQCNQLLVPTPTGERQWGSIKVGDLLFARDGSPTKVLEKFEHTDWPFYRVEFDDGSFTFAGPEHLWAVRGRQERRKGLSGWRVMSTEEIIATGVLRSNGVAEARQWEIPTQGAVQFDAREVPVHPYILGVWLGDGTRNAAQYCKPHPEIAERIRALGVGVSNCQDGKAHGLIGQTGGLRETGVFDLGSHDRYIPDAFKYNAIEIRRQVLEGLLDTDGECGKDNKSVGYSTTSLHLARDVMWLARSLGGKATMQPSPKQGWYPDTNGVRKICRVCYRVTINLPWNPFTVEHRRERYTPSEDRYTKRWIAKIEFSHFGDGHCVVVGNTDHLYQANDFIVTHNSALVAWVVHWFISTRPHPKIVLMANTRDQLLKTTFREVAVWHKRLINKHWFEWTATKFYNKEHPETWFAEAKTWSKEHTESVAGTHEKHVLIIFDESSGIDEKVWEVTEGALTTKGAVWLVFGNPTRNSGRFRECFGRYQHRWTTYQVDSRSAKMATNKSQIQQWIDDYGDDSDFVRVRIKGEFPRAGSTQFIPGDLVDRAMQRSPIEDPQAVRVLSVDVARFGDDQTVFMKRHGSTVLPLRKFRGLDTMQTAAFVAEEIDSWHPDCTFVDGSGVGGGVVDRLRSLNYRVVDVQAGSSPDDKEKYANKRAEMWGRMRDWLKGDVCLPPDPELGRALTGIEYGFNNRNAIQLEKKEDMKLRGLASPDEGDALAYSFAEPVRAFRELILPNSVMPRHRPRGVRSDLNWRLI